MMNSKQVVRQPRGPPLEVEEGQKNWRSSKEQNEQSISTDENKRKSSISSAYGAESPKSDQGTLEFEDIFGPSEELVYITYIESPSLFWAQMADEETEEKVKHLTENLQVFCGNRPLLQSLPILRKLYGGIYAHDNLWYRCRILENLDDSKVKVHFVDFGNTEVISQREVVYLSPELYSHPAYAKQYKLNGVNDPKDPNSEDFTKGVELLSRLTADKNLTARKSGAYKSATSACPVDLLYLQENQLISLNQEMIKAGFSESQVVEEKPLKSEAMKKAEASPYQTPVTSSTRVLSSTDYTPLRKPSVKEPQEAKVQELEETVKSQSKTIETLKQMCQQLEHSKKLELDDRERKFKEQLEQANNQLNHAVSTKVTQLLSKVQDLRKIRKESIEQRNKALSCLVNAMDLLNEQKKKSSDSENKEELTKVQEAENRNVALQDKIRQCTEKDILPGLVEERNKAREVLNESITAFTNCVQDMQLDLLKVKLQVALTSLELYIGDSSDCTKASVNTPNTEIEYVEEYKKFMAKKEEDLKEMHVLVNEKCQLLSDVYLRIIKLLNLNDELDSTEASASVGDLDDMMSVLEALIQEEVAKTKSSEAEETLKGKAVAALLIELHTQLASVEEYRQNFDYYKCLQEKLQESLNIKPDVDKALVNKKNIRKLTTQLKHKQLDEVELKEADDDDTEEDLQKLQEELNCLYGELHKAFVEEDTIINNLANLTKEHFPELLLSYPELGIGLCLETNGLVKSGRTVDQYPLEELESGVFISSFCGKKCLIKEYFFRDTTSKNHFQSKALEFHSCVGKQLIELQAVFYNKNGRIGYLQVPYYKTLEEWLKTSPPQEAKKRVMKGVLEGLEVLHSSGIVHGSISDATLLVSHDENEEVTGLLGHYNFHEEMDSRVKNSAERLSLPQDVANCTPKFDLICVGHLAASLAIPEWKSSCTLNDLNLLSEDADLRSLIKGLLFNESILTAHDALMMTYFKENTGLQNGHLSGPVDEELD